MKEIGLGQTLIAVVIETVYDSVCLGFFLFVCLFVLCCCCCFGGGATIAAVAVDVAVAAVIADADAAAAADVDDEGELHVVHYVWWTLYNLRPSPHICWKYGHNVP